MKRVFSILICAVLLASLPAAPASAETDLSAYSISNGTVQASRFEDLTAPCSGTLLPFDWSAGDTVDAGDVLFQMMTTRVTAPVNGSVSALFVEEGDSADAAMATYGTVLAIEPEYISRMHASYLTAYENQDCLHVHVGQPLWFKFGSEEGTGIVISTADEYYEVEIHTGDYNIGRKIGLYKDEDYSYDCRVGEGIVYRRDDVTRPRRDGEKGRYALRTAGPGCGPGRRAGGELAGGRRDLRRRCGIRPAGMEGPAAGPHQPDRFPRDRGGCG